MMHLTAGVHFLHGFQVRRNASAFLKRTEQTEERRDVRWAADYLSRSLVCVPWDTDAVPRCGLLPTRKDVAANKREIFRRFGSRSDKPQVPQSYPTLPARAGLLILSHFSHRVCAVQPAH
jgi:hypothetical protein